MTPPTKDNTVKSTVSSVRLQVTISGKLNARLQKMCGAKGLKDTDAARTAIDEYLTKNNY